MTSTATIEELVHDNRPQQFALLEDAFRVFTQSRAVTHLLVRGSLAAGTADRMSDLDFVIGIEDEDFIAFVQALDALMDTELGALLPGWRDTIVARMGGVGYVFLVLNEDVLYQIDIYAVPASLVPSVQARTAARLIHGGIADDASVLLSRELTAFVEAEHCRPKSCGELVVEILVLIQMMLKRIKRAQHFVLYAENHMLMTAVKDLLKAALVPESKYWGWYQLNEEFGVTPIGRECLRHLASLISAPLPPTSEALAHTLSVIEDVLTSAVPDVHEALRPAINAYKHYLELT